MSRDNQPANLRLLGSPVNLTSRGKKKNDKKNIRNRPRSALQTSSFNPDCYDRYRRPFSADGKSNSSDTNNLLKAFSVEVLQCNPLPRSVKVVPPTTDILRKSKTFDDFIPKKDKELCSNASDYGSEDTFVSLGTKIKARAQSNTKSKQANRNYLKYRNIATQDKKLNDNIKMENTDYDMEVEITEKPQENSTFNHSQKDQDEHLHLSPHRTYEPSYFAPFGSEKQKNEKVTINHDPLRSDFLSHEVEQAIDTYSRRLSLTRQQLSLVEEESTQDLSSLSAENSLDNGTNLTSNTQDVKDTSLTDRLKYFHNDIIVPKEEHATPRNFPFDDGTYEPRTYKSFYDDFQTTKTDLFKSRLSSHTDTCSKDSGYTDSGSNEEKSFKRNNSLPNAASMFNKKANKHVNADGEPKSLDSAPFNKRINKNLLSTYPPDKMKFEWTEPLNHSRLLYKDFFIQKEGSCLKVPQNSPNKSDTKHNIAVKEEDVDNVTGVNEAIALEYPSYLLNSNTKAYTSKVIEDYKKEIEAINSLHELTLRDIKTDAISPTPLSVDNIFDQVTITNSHGSRVNSPSNEKQYNRELSSKNQSPPQSASDKRNISNISTKELIENYLKVKESDLKKTKDTVPKHMSKFDRKLSLSEDNGIVSKNHSTGRTVFGKSLLPMHIKNQTQRNMFTVKTPLSARIASVENDRDIDSWMSLSKPSPRMSDVNNMDMLVNNEENECEVITAVEENIATPRLVDNPNETSRNEMGAETLKELNSKSSVLDIYSMLKEIESYGENPVNVMKDDPPVPQSDQETDNSSVPKDNFMEIFEFLEKVEQSANDALSIVTNTTPQTLPKLEGLLRLPQTELAQRLITASLQLEERSCCIALLQESLANHKQQMIAKVSSLEKQSIRNVTKVKQECEEAIKRHQNFIDQLINDKKTLNHRIEQLVDERRSLEERWKRSAQALEDRYKLELKNQHDKMVASQQVARQRWVRQKAEKIKELTVKGLEGELREMSERQQKEVSELKAEHAEREGRALARHRAELERLRRDMDGEREAALLNERQRASSRMEKQILELEMTYQEQRTRLVAEMRAENEKVASGLTEKERNVRNEIEKWREEQEKLIEEKKVQCEEEISKRVEILEQEMQKKRRLLEEELERHKKEYEAEQQMLFKKREKEICAQFKQERDKEIEKAIESMDAEAQTGRKELQEALRRNKEQYETELRELAETEQATLRRYQDAQARVRQTEDKCAELEVTISQLETRNRLLTEKNSQLELRADEVRSSCEESWRRQVEDIRQKMEEARRTHEDQMHQLYAKVKIAVARKDSTIQALTREASKSQEKVALLEQKLQQQRKDYLKHK